MDFIRPLYELAKQEHQCASCKRWKFGINWVTTCCREPICDDCSDRKNWIVRRGGLRVCRLPGCGHEYS